MRPLHEIWTTFTGLAPVVMQEIGLDFRADVTVKTLMRFFHVTLLLPCL